MRFNVTRLCGGKALMAASCESMDIDMDRAAKIANDLGTVKHKDSMMIVMDWNEMEVTIYPQGKVMFHPLSDRDLAVEYATKILEMIR
jgi:ArsR family metal-binding transcriptional regulator